jgi:tRNA-binding EMAP/Myf-like protein
MPVIAMKCTSKTAHEKTDQLFIYTFESPALGEVTIVANLTNVYEVGQMAGIAQLGTWLPEGEIRPRKVFGIPSEGMAMGPVDAALDADLSQQFEADATETTFKITIEVDVRSRYVNGAEKLARKAIGKGEGSLKSAANV